MTTRTPICMCEEFWANSQFSVARYSGRIAWNGHTFWILDKNGRDLWECTADAILAGRKKAIEAGEPADLVRDDFRKVYRDLGRDKFLEILRAESNYSDTEILKTMKAEIRKLKRRKKQ